MYIRTLARILSLPGFVQNHYFFPAAASRDKLHTLILISAGEIHTQIQSECKTDARAISRARYQWDGLTPR